ncbi:YbaK/EbsC family protein [Propylenella binzhouense]|uniref:YbaK/EbsC family protein n=1 Tax=Propylenella binzhouense TaxID=2555902 RepID=A0A964T1U6_9HYPH|nr:YbaK/EbsC family protein [Propylenella binzhouense]MYZ46720.1 YbaK/EbsC family protein [Propylenella binzhouense]
MQERLRSTDRVKLAAEACGLPIEIVEMPQSTRTAEEAAAACGTTVAQIVKSLVFRKASSGETVLILVSGVNRVDEKTIAGLLGDRLERPDARAVRDATGFAIGGVAPIGSIRPIATYMDRDLLSHETVWAAAGSPNAVFAVSPDALQRASGAEVIAVR